MVVCGVERGVFAIAVVDENEARERGLCKDIPLILDF
jgi:hypothetical protein